MAGQDAATKVAESKIEQTGEKAVAKISLPSGHL
jgi:hypothetical protein